MTSARMTDSVPVYLGLHLMGRGDVTLPNQARYDEGHYIAEFTFTTDAAALRYDAITVYNAFGNQINLIPLAAPRSVRVGERTRARVEMDPHYEDARP